MIKSRWVEYEFISIKLDHYPDQIDKFTTQSIILYTINKLDNDTSTKLKTVLTY